MSPQNASSYVSLSSIVSAVQALVFIAVKFNCPRGHVHVSLQSMQTFRTMFALVFYCSFNNAASMSDANLTQLPLEARMRVSEPLVDQFL